MSSLIKKETKFSQMEQQLENHIVFMKNAGVEDIDIAIWVKGYNKAKETLFTEEQVMEAIDMATTSKYDYKLEFYNSDEIIKSLKK